MAHGQTRQPPWDTVDWDADPDWEWRTAAEDTPEQLLALWQDAVARSRSAGRRGVGRRWPGASWPGAPGPMVGHPACGGSWST